MFRRFDLRIEIISIICIISQLFFYVIIPGLEIAPFIISSFLYIVLTIVMYYSLSPGVVINPNYIEKKLGTKHNLNENEKLFFLRRSIFFAGLFKFCILLIPSHFLFFQVFLGDSKYLGVTFVILFLVIGFYSLFLMGLNIIKANGYTESGYKEVLKYGIIYNNPDDKRGVVEKPYGLGVTVNLATNEGRLILGVLLAIPLTIVLLLIFLS
ncbi:MAG TPA: hypothetical protein PK559_11995 [Ignavibacteriaceae bacterium]|nr:hypothetical protein [Ignavibacteriaceae bacterium]